MENHWPSDCVRRYRPQAGPVANERREPRLRKKAAPVGQQRLVVEGDPPLADLPVWPHLDSPSVRPPWEEPRRLTDVEAVGGWVVGRVLLVSPGLGRLDSPRERAAGHPLKGSHYGYPFDSPTAGRVHLPTPIRHRQLTSHDFHEFPNDLARSFERSSASLFRN